MYRGSRLLRSLRLSTVSATVALLVVAAGMRPAPAQESTGDETAPVPVVDTISDRELENLPAEEKEREVTSMRTQGSRTFATPEGHYRTELFTHSIHHRDGEGAWQPIDDTLVSSTKASYEWENAANRYTLLLPEDLSEAPVLVEEGGHWVAMSLPGAAAAGAAAQEEATYDEALPGVSLSYAATPDAVKESIVLEGPKSPSTIEFVLKASPGLAPAKTADGGVVLLTPEGQVAFTFSPPFMVDSAEPEPAVSSDVSLEVGKKGGNLTLAVVADEKWLASPDRVWPVTIDPTTTFPTPGKDCFISSDQPNTSSCGVNRVRVGYNGTGKRRGLVVFNMGEIPRQAVVLDADFTMELVNTTTILQADYDVHRLTNTWNNSATWNRYNGDSPWATPGGDFSPGLFGTRNLGFTTGPKTWNLTELTQQWINGISVNHGMLIKQRGENVTNVLAFASDEDPSLPAPKLEVTWSHFLGEQRYYTFEEQRLNEAMHVHVNVTNGNLVLHEEDLGVAGTGLDLKVDRYFNNLSVEETRLGPGWVLGTGPEVRLIELASGHVAYHGPSGYRVRFKKGEGGNYVSPTGVDADLEKKNFGWDLEFHSKEVFHFAENGNLLRHEDKNGNDITYTYDNDRRLLDIVDTQGRQVTFQYTGARMTKMTDVAGGREYRYGYDADGRLATYTDPENATPTQFIYTTGGSLRRIIDPRGNSTLMTYDDQRRVTSITRVTNPQNDTGPRTDFIYELSDSRCPDEADTVTEVNDPRRNLTRYCHDEGAKVHEVIDAKGNSTTKKYNANSNVSEFTEAGAPAAYLFQWDTDGGDDLEGIAMPTGGQASMEYNDTEKNPHFPTEVWDFQTKDDAPATYTYDYDDNGNLKEVTASDLYDPWFSYEYNLPGKGTLKKITDGRGNETLFSYDPGGNLTEIDPPGPHGTLQFTYDAISRVRTMTDGRGRISTFTYDKLDRLVRIDYDDATFITYTYDPNGNLTRRRDAAGTWQFSYDQLNRMTAQQNPLPAEAISYTYDASGNMETITDAGGTLTYSYDETNLMDGISDPVEGHLTFSYNKRYLRTRAEYPNGLKLGFAWDDSRRLCNTVATTGTLPAPADFGCDTEVASPMEQFRYDYQSPDDLDTTLRHEVTDKAGRETTYSYDDIARLSRARTVSSGGSELSDFLYDYDPNGNLTKEVASGVTTNLDYNAGNELTCTVPGGSATCGDPGTVTYDYDGAGNLASTSQGLALTYNAKGQTSRVTPPGASQVNMVYGDADQTRRVRAGSREYTYTQLGLTGEKQSQARTFFVRDPEGTLLYQRTPTGTHYVIPDALGSTVGLVNGSGARVATYDYEPYGELTTATGSASTPLRFASGYFDSQWGATKFGTRYYQPEVARWTQHDPERGQLTNPLSLNAYLYVSGNPVNVTDTSGRVLPFLLAGLIGILVGIGAGAILEALGVEPPLSSGLAGCIGGGLAAALTGAGIFVVLGWCGAGALFALATE